MPDAAYLPSLWRVRGTTRTFCSALSRPALAFLTLHPTTPALELVADTAER